MEVLLRQAAGNIYTCMHVSVFSSLGWKSQLITLHVCLLITPLSCWGLFILLLILNPPVCLSVCRGFISLCFLDIWGAEHLFAVTETLPSKRFHLLSVRNYCPLFCVHKDWIYGTDDTTKTKSRHSNLIDVRCKSIFQSRPSSRDYD